MRIPLSAAPQTIESFNEIATRYDDKLADAYNKITPQERIFMYYLYRASLPGNRILADQIHQNSNDIIDLFTTIISNKEKLRTIVDKNQSLKIFNLEAFLKQAECYWVYVWTNHGQYFAMENAKEKRTPERLNLDLLTEKNLTAIFDALGLDKESEKISQLARVLFDTDYQSTNTVENNIEQSSVNIYAQDFTENDYQKITPAEQEKLNNYFFVDSDTKIPKAIAYSTQEHFSQELSITCFWLQKAYDYAQKFPQIFDSHVVKSLELLIQFFQTGDENYFKQHSIEWIKCSSRVDYNLGFIETYKDPKNTRGFFQAEATIKIIDIECLNKLLPQLEKQMPIPQAFKRDNLDNATTAIPNASINCKVFGTGELGPLKITAAYCLPNYPDIRAQYGSKQIMYPSTKSLAQTVNPDGYLKLFFLRERSQWLENNDPQCQFLDDLWDLHCILHETIGHGSGKNVKEYTAEHEATMEELRAEIIALYISLVNIDQLISCGFLKKWATKITKPELQKWFIFHMANDALRRLIQQNDTATEITGDHARANCIITYFLHDKNCLSIGEEQVLWKNKPHTVLGITNIDLEKTIQEVTHLMQEVQRIKSTNDGAAARQLVETYGRPLRNPHHMKALKENLKALQGNLRISAILHPIFTPLYDGKTGELLDVQATWPKNIFELAAHMQTLELSIK